MTDDAYVDAVCSRLVDLHVMPGCRAQLVKLYRENYESTPGRIGDLRELTCLLTVVDDAGLPAVGLPVGSQVSFTFRPDEDLEIQFADLNKMLSKMYGF